MYSTISLNDELMRLDASCGNSQPILRSATIFNCQHAHKQTSNLPVKTQQDRRNNTRSASVHHLGDSVIRGMGLGPTEFLSAQPQQNFDPQFQHDRGGTKKNSLSNLQVPRRFCKEPRSVKQCEIEKIMVSVGRSIIGCNTVDVRRKCLCMLMECLQAHFREATSLEAVNGSKSLFHLPSHRRSTWLIGQPFRIFNPQSPCRLVAINEQSLTPSDH